MGSEPTDQTDSQPDVYAAPADGERLIREIKDDTVSLFEKWCVILDLTLCLMKFLMLAGSVMTVANDRSGSGLLSVPELMCDLSTIFLFAYGGYCILLNRPVGYWICLVGYLPAGVSMFLAAARFAAATRAEFLPAAVLGMSEMLFVVLLARALYDLFYFIILTAIYRKLT